MPLSPDDVYPAGAGAPPVALIDVRSPGEVARGALPGAHALPLMTDDERHLVGLRYAEAGQEAAIALGYELAGPHLAARAAAWRAVADAGPTAVACWRGGLRSALAVRHLDRPGVETVAGGYKALRRHLMAGLRRAVDAKRVVVLGGLTGSGKTEVLRALGGVPDLLALDLEALARHRGSAFGAEDDPQPAQATFENAVAAAIVLDPAPRILTEDESRFVGRRTVPDALWAAMRGAPVVWLEAPLQERVRRVYDGYVHAPAERHGVAAARARLENDVRRVRKRLGGQRCDAVLGALEAAANAWFDPDAHAGWIATLLEDYYDKLYLRAFQASGRARAFAGNAGEVVGFLARPS
ncbi:MAG: tRNA 2-selenouridine(34) synthase MnmH [Trueperaceae bacterium]